MSNTVLDLRKVEYLLADRDRLLQQLDQIKTRGTIEALAPAMGEDYREQLLVEMERVKGEIEAINAVLPCVDLLQQFGTEVYKVVVDYFPQITFKTTLEKAYENHSIFYWQPPVPPARIDWPPPISINMDKPARFEINLVKFTDGKKIYGFYHLRDHDVLFYREPVIR